MSAVTKLMTPGGGGVSLTPASSIASDVTVNVPSSNGTLVSTGETAQVSQAMLASGVAGNGPAFSAYNNANQSVTSSTFTKLNFNTEVFDTNSNFDSSRFTPTVAGYYNVSIAIAMATGVTQVNTFIYKNGSLYSGSISLSGSAVGLAGYVQALVYMNGSTDYIEGYVYPIGTTPSVAAGFTYSSINGCLVRAA